MFENLESRRMLSTGKLSLASDAFVGSGNLTIVYSVNGDTVLQSFGGTITKTETLLVKGNASNDVLSVVRDGNKIKYNTRIGDGGIYANFVVDASKVKRVYVEAGGGNDKVFIDEELQKNCTVLGGGGNDTIEGNSSSTLIGGSGNDKLSVPPTGVIVVGGEPGEVITGVWTSSLGSALLSGGDGDDILLGKSTDTVVGGRGDDLLIQRLIYNRFPATNPTFDVAGDFDDRASGIERMVGEAYVRQEGKLQLFAGTAVLE